MQPPHAVEDMVWARFRIGRERLRGAYAWRTLRLAGAAVVFGSDLSGSDHDIFYGLHAAITRRNKQKQPEGGWFPEQRMTAEEAIRGYTSWPAYASFLEEYAKESLTRVRYVWAVESYTYVTVYPTGSTARRRFPNVS